MMGRRLNPLASIQSLPRDLQLLFWSFFLWTFGLGLYNYVWPLFLEQLHATPSQVGLVFSIGFVAIAVTLIPGGILANRYELKTLLIVGWILSIPVPLIYYFAGTWTDVIPGIILVQASGFNLPAFNAYIVGAGQRAKVASNFGTIWAAAPLGIVFSPVVGSILLGVFRIRDIFILSFIFFTVSTIVLFFIKRQPPLEKDAKASKLELPRSFPEATLLVYLTGAAIAVDITSPFLPLYFHDIFGLQPASIQLLGAAQSLGSATFAILLSKRADTASRGRTMATGLLLSSSGILGIALTGNPLFAFPLVFLFGSARAPSLIAYSILSNIRQGASRAGQYGFYLTLESLGFVGGSYLGGVLYTINPAIGLYTTAAVFLTLAIVAALTKFQSKRTLVTFDVGQDGKEFKAARDRPEGIDGPV
jgi:MFS family permease